MNGFIVLSLLSKNTFSVMIILIDEYDLLLLKKIKHIRMERQGAWEVGALCGE